MARVNKKRKKKGACPNEQQRVSNLPISGVFYLGKLVAFLVAVALGVDTDVFLAARTVFLVEVCFEGGVAIFPSDALLGFGLDLNPSLCGLLLLLGVVLVRRREDAQRDGDSGVKVQIAELRRVGSCKPLEVSRKQFERIQEQDSCFFYS
jgi:hypothetical protein